MSPVVLEEGKVALRCPTSGEGKGRKGPALPSARTGFYLSEERQLGEQRCSGLQEGAGVPRWTSASGSSTEHGSDREEWGQERDFSKSGCITAR